MCVYIGIEDLVANAFIELLGMKSDREILFRDLDEYGAMVVKCLNQRQEAAVLLLSKERTNTFLHDYTDFFELYTDNTYESNEGIRLKDGVTVERLWETFRCYLSVDIMLAFMDKTAVSKLGVGEA